MNRKYALAIAALSALLLGDPCFAQAPSQPDSLEGLWKAKRWFGHFDKSRLIIQRTGKIYTADMLGRTLPVRVEKDDLTFVWPGERGRFRGRLDAGGIRGHWIRLGGKGGVASPVFLAPRGTDRWMGDVEAGRTEFTFYLLLKKRPDGSFAALLGNPERDMGSQFGVNRLTREGNVVRLFAKRNAQAEERELSSGTFDPENETITLSFPSRGGSFDFTREDDDSEFYPRGKNPGSYTYTLPPALGDGWITATPEQVSIDRKGLENTVQVLLNAPMDSVGTPKVHALLVARHGKLILEEYFHGENRERIHQLYSGGKSITSMIIGAAMYAGTPLKLSSRVYEVMNGGTMPADVDPRKRAMTLENLMTMSPGYFCDDQNDDAPGTEDKMHNQDEPYYTFTMKLPLISAPGENAVYCSGTANLAMGMLGRTTGEFQLDTFDRLIARPLKINRYNWWVVPDGNAYGAGANGFTARDFLKLGQLMLNGGTWEGRRIMSREFVERSTAPLYHLWGWQYGYFWWSVELPYKNRTVHAFFAGGAGGQTVIVIPALDVVIASFGGNFFSPGGWYVQFNLTPQYLLPAVREAGDNPHAAVVPRKDFAPKRWSQEDSGPIKH